MVLLGESETEVAKYLLPEPYAVSFMTAVTARASSYNFVSRRGDSLPCFVVSPSPGRRRLLYPPVAWA